MCVFVVLVVVRVCVECCVFFFEVWSVCFVWVFFVFVCWWRVCLFVFFLCVPRCVFSLRLCCACAALDLWWGCVLCVFVVE